MTDLEKRLAVLRDQVANLRKRYAGALLFAGGSLDALEALLVELVRELDRIAISAPLRNESDE